MECFSADEEEDVLLGLPMLLPSLEVIGGCEEKAPVLLVACRRLSRRLTGSDGVGTAASEELLSLVRG